MELEFNQTDQGVVNEVIVILGRRGTGKTRVMEALAPLLVSRRDQLVIVSPIPTLKSRMPDITWYKISVRNKAAIDKLFRKFTEADPPVQKVLLCDEGDELTAANASGTAGGFVAQGTYDFVNYGREQGLGIVLSSRRPANIAKDVTANANHVFVGNTTDPAALDYYSAWMYDPEHPEVDYREICRVLPDHVFMVWSPIAGRKFLGYVEVDMDRMELREWIPTKEDLDPSKATPTVPGAESTGPSGTIGTNGTGSGGESGSGSDAPAVG